MIQDELIDLSYIAWEAYCKEYILRYRHRPPYVNRPPNNKPVYKAFYKIAVICQNNDFEIYDYIKTCFDMSGKNSEYITPNDFVIVKCIQDHRDYLKHQANASHSLVIYMMNNINLDHLSERLSLPKLKILSCATYSFPSWFRVFALNEYNEDVWKWYGQTTWDSFRLDTQLRRLIKSKHIDVYTLFEKIYGRFGD